MKGHCNRCNKLNEESPCGYFYCNCKKYGHWYLPTVVFEKRKIQQMLDNFPDEEKDIEPQTI